MSAEDELPPGPDPDLGPDPGPAAHPDTAPDAAVTFRDNQQSVERGAALMAGGDIHIYGELATDRVTSPRLREGPYPAREVADALRGLVEPPAAAQCREALDRRVLVLSAEDGHGVGTAALALLVERHGTGGIVGLDPAEDLSRWEPQPGRGYLLRGLPQQAADALGEVALRGLAERLRHAGSHLVATVGREVRLPPESHDWQRAHQAPAPYDVAARRLRVHAEQGSLTAEQTHQALEFLASPAVTAHLRAHPLPADAVDVAEGVRAAVTDGTPVDALLENLRLNSDKAAAEALERVRHSADGVSLIAAVALLHGQDRTTIERFAARVRALLPGPRRPDDTTPGPSNAPTEVLGPPFEDRLKAVGAELLAPEWASSGGHRHRLQRVTFIGRHRPDTLLRRLWLDHEGMAALLWRALERFPYQPGLDLAAGQAIGRVLARATGTHTLAQLSDFASSHLRWHRRLVAYACGEVAQRPGLGGLVHEQLRQWSRQARTAPRCTVAETCAGAYGLARPTAAVRLLGTVLDRRVDDGEDSLRGAVSFALSVLCTERPNRALVLHALTEWLAADPGSPRHAMAADAVRAMSTGVFPRPGRRGPTRLSLGDLLVDHQEQTLPLVAQALATSATYDAVADGLLALATDPDPGRRAALADVTRRLSTTAPGDRGVVRFSLRFHRQRASVTPQERNVS